MECIFVVMQLVIVMQHLMNNARSGTICTMKTKILMVNLVVYQTVSVTVNVNVLMGAAQVGPGPLEILMNQTIYV